MAEEIIEPNSLKDLIIRAGQKSQEFADKYTYWMCRRQKTPDQDWLMNELESVLGRDVVLHAAQEYIESMDAKNVGQSQQSGS